MTPHSSCAVDFLHGLPVPAALMSADWFLYSVVYGVLVLEFVAMLLLFSSRTKYYGMLIGIPFHIIIGISAYGTLAHFSAFAIALHALFLPESFASRVAADPLVPGVLKRPRTLQIVTVIIVVAFAWFANLGWGAATNTVFAIFAIAQFALTIRHGRHLPDDPPFELVSRTRLVNVMPAVFLFHCWGPYIGLSTEGAVQMFSGLRTEGGISNHYVIRKPWYLFDYQRDVVEFVYAEDEYLSSLIRRGQGLLLTDFNRFLGTLEAPLQLPLVMRINGVDVAVTTAAQAQAFEQRYVFPLSYLEYKFLVFRDVDAPEPNACRH